MFIPASFFGRAASRLILGLGCCILGLLGSMAAQSPGTFTRTFDLPADVAEKTLKLFSEQSGRGLIVAAEMVIDIRTNAVRGQFTAREALDRMLAGTKLAAKEDPKNGAFVIRREDPGPNGQRAAHKLTRERPTK